MTFCSIMYVTLSRQLNSVGDLTRSINTHVYKTIHLLIVNLLFDIVFKLKVEVRVLLTPSSGKGEA